MNANALPTVQVGVPVDVIMDQTTRSGASWSANSRLIEGTPEALWAFALAIMQAVMADMGTRK